MFTESDYGRLDFRLLQNGSVNLFHDSDILKEACDELRTLDYAIDEVFCREGKFEAQISLALGFEWTGNLNALLDGLRDYPFGRSGRAALVLHDYQRLVSESPRLAWSVLDLIENAARDLLLENKLLVTLVQTSDPAFTCEGLGARAAQWNPREWTLTARGLASK